MSAHSEARTIHPGAVIESAWYWVRCSWWAPAYVVAAVVGLAVLASGGGWAALCPAAGPALATAAVPKLRARAVDGARCAWLSWNVRRDWAWTMRNPDGAKLDVHPRLSWRLFTGRDTRHPRIRTVRRDGATVVVEVESLRGIDAIKWRENADELAMALQRSRPKIVMGARTVTLRFPPEGASTLPAWTADPPDRLPDLTRLPVARSAHGPAHLRILGTHVLITGATGSGKGSVVWSIIRTLTPGIADGTVQVWAIDPKGGIELGLGRELFARFAGGDPERIAHLLEDAVAAMDARLADMLADHSRLHRPRRGAPLIVIVVDEFLSLTATVQNRAVRARIDAALVALLSKGRAPGVSVVAATQLAQKDAIKSWMRDLIPTRVCLRVADAEQVDMALGAGARKAGALADQIDDDSPGTGYLLEDGGRPVMVRFPWASDAAIRDLANRYPAPAAPTPAPPCETPARAAATARPSKRDAVEALLDAWPADVAVDVEKIAAAADCTGRYVRRILAERPATARNTRPGTVGASRNEVPPGDPTSAPEHFAPDTPPSVGAAPAHPWHVDTSSDVLAEPDTWRAAS